MLEWYKDKTLAIYFNTLPKVYERYITPLTENFTQKSIKKYPYINKELLMIFIFDYKKSKKYSFTIPMNYCFDGATIPRIVWNIVGSPTDNKYIIGALVHDWICEQHECIDCDRELSTKIFRSLIIKGGTNKIQAYIMSWFVDLFQRLFCNW